MTQQVNILTLSLTNNSATTITAKRGVNWAGAQAVAGEACMGVANADIEVGVNGTINLGPTVIWEVGAAIDGVENRLMTDADGRLIPWTAGSAVVARTWKGQTATVAGQFLEVFVVNQQVDV